MERRRTKFPTPSPIGRGLGRGRTHFIFFGVRWNSPLPAHPHPAPGHRLEKESSETRLAKRKTDSNHPTFAFDLAGGRI